MLTKRNLTVALTAAFLVFCTSIGCAPPPEPYRAPAPISNPSKGDTTIRNVTLTEAEWKKEAQILSVRLPELIGSSADISELRELYVGSARYAIARCKTLSQEDRWLLFCFNTGELELLAKDAALVSHGGIDSFDFTVTETENGIIKLPRSIQYLRVSGELREYMITNQSLPAVIAGHTGPVNANGKPINYEPLPSLDLLRITALGIEMGFSRTSGDGLFYPFTDISYDGAFKITLNGCLLSGSALEAVTPSAFSIVKSIEVKQIGINIEIKITLSLNEPHYSFTAVEQTPQHSVTALVFSLAPKGAETE